MKTVTKDWLREYFEYRDGKLFAIKHRPHSKVTVGDELGGLHKPSGRFRAVLFGRKYGIHQLVWIYFNGTLPAFGIDHRDRNFQNNRIGNLRECTAKTNAENIDGERGVIETQSGTWQAHITHNGKKTYLGTYPTRAEALEVRRDKERDLFEYSPLNGV